MGALRHVLLSLFVLKMCAAVKCAMYNCVGASRPVYICSAFCHDYGNLNRFVCLIVAFVCLLHELFAML